MLRLLAVATAALASGSALAAQDAPTPSAPAARSPAHTHIRHVAESFRGTPDRRGLLPTAVAEAEIAVRHAALAGSEPADLAAMQRHAGHVLHALDPSAIEGGPGLGYGVIRAAERTAHWAGLAVASDGGGDAIRTHGPHVAGAARGAAVRAGEAAEVAREVMEADSAEEAAALVERLVELVTQMTDGLDADADGRISWQEAEGGLAQARQHLDFLLSGEGLTG